MPRVTGALSAIAAALAPVAALAQTTVTPIGDGLSLGSVSVSVKGDGSIADYLGAAYKVGVVAVAALAVLVIAWGAVEVMGESFYKKADGRQRIWNAVLGLLLALGSVVILQTISTSLLSVNLSSLSSLGDAVDSRVASQQAVSLKEGLTVTGSAGSQATSGSASGSASGSTGTSGSTSTNGENRPWEGGTYSVPAELSGAEYDAYVRNIFGANGISVNKSYGANSSSNTNLDGLSEVAIQGLVTMKSESGADAITVTGGTEPGHSAGTYSHGGGYKIDVRPGNSSFDSYITSTFTKTGTSGIGDTYSRSYGTYTVNVIREDDHWDLQFQPN